MINKLLHSKLNVSHLIIMSLLFGISTYIIMNYLIIFLIWGYVGDGAYPKS